ncbi:MULTISPECIES: hypothetical protein [unclassified Lentilitoribacter]|uniref:hypothetical protein n=1 Tax=unclassified Lentilitoribacter TaxID=2647570 RepID=UPI0013A6C15A|nr:hypothetical protein [Lentilitoribacter sp. Alg239-R112]
MKKSSLTNKHEKIVAHAIAPIAKELRLIDVADLIAMLKYEKHGSLSDLVTSAAELYFLPDTVKLGSGGDYQVDWDNDPKILLDLEISLKTTTVYTRLSLEKNHCSIEINHIQFEQAIDDPELSSHLLQEQFEQAAFSMHRIAINHEIGKIL